MVKGAIPYRDTIAAPGSQLHKAITEGNLKLAKQVYEATTERFVALTRQRQEEDFPDVPF